MATYSRQFTAFLSYARESSEIAQQIVTVLEAFGCRVFDYQQAHSTGVTPNSDGWERFRLGAQNADFFVQILKSDVGSTIDGQPALIAERNWYLTQQSARHRYPPFVLVMPDGTGSATTTEYRNSLGAEACNCNSPRDAVATAIKWLLNLRDPSETHLLSGVLDPRLVSIDIDKEVQKCILDDALFPQKYLYTSPVGGMLWKRLISQGAVGKSWENISFRNATDPIPHRIINHLGTVVPRLSIMALGCGEGGREAIMKSRLTDWTSCTQANVMLVDASKTLISAACKNFVEQVHHETNVTFALVDFEHPDVLPSLRFRMGSDDPCVVLFLGNTLGNISVKAFLRYMSDALRPGDVLVFEVRLLLPEEAKSAAEEAQHQKLISAPTDTRFDFVTNPIRFFGLNPDKNKYFYSVEKTRVGYRKTFEYAFDDKDEAALVKRPFSSEIRNHTRLKLVQVEAFDDEALLKNIRSAGFTIIDDVVEAVVNGTFAMGWVVAVKNPRT